MSAYILVLKQLRDAKEQRRGLLRTERLPDIEEIHYSREQCPAPPWTDGRFIEYAGFLDDRGFVVVVRAQAALLLLFGLEAEGAKGSHERRTAWGQGIEEL